MQILCFRARPWLALLCIAALYPAFADDIEKPDEDTGLPPFYLRLGVYFLDSSTAARVDGIGGNFGTRLDFEDDLNLEKRKDTMLAAARWRFRDRHFLEIEYFSLKRYGFKRIERQIQFGESTFAAGADINSSFSTEVTRVGYAYRIVKHPDWGLGLSAGLHVTRLRASLDSVVLDNGGVPDIDGEIASVSAPLPVFGITAARRLGEKWILTGKSQWFFLKLDDIEGSLTHAAIFLEFNAYRNLGFGLGYDWFDIDADSTDTYWRGSADVRFSGPMVFVQASF
jgi:hypothetical protein